MKGRVVEGLMGTRCPFVEEVSAVAHFPALLLLVGLIVAAGSACQRQEDSVPSVHSQEQPAGAAKDQDAPVLMARRALAESNHELAYYALLHAIRTDPENPAVFDFVLKVADEFLHGDPSEWRDFGEDLLVRAELLLPYLPLASLEESWSRWSNALERLEAGAVDSDSRGSSSGLGVGSRLDSLAEEIGLVASKQKIPPRAHLILLQQAKNDLDALGVSNALQDEHTGQSGSDVWLKWNKLVDHIESLERDVLADLFCAENAAEVNAWLVASSSLIHAFSPPEAIDEAALLMERATAIRQFVRAGMRWERDLKLLSEAGIGEPRCLSDPGDHRVTTQGRIRELQWRYSYGQILPWLRVLASVQFVEREGVLWWKKEDQERLIEASNLFPVVLTAPATMPLTLADEVTAEAGTYVEDRREKDTARGIAMSRLILHLVVDRELLEPYVHSRFEESWRKQEDNLDDEGRLIAAKLRVWLELR